MVKMMTIMEELIISQVRQMKVHSQQNLATALSKLNINERKEVIVIMIMR